MTQLTAPTTSRKAVMAAMMDAKRAYLNRKAAPKLPII
jgi:hypothetical protein